MSELKGFENAVKFWYDRVMSTIGFSYNDVPIPYEDEDQRNKLIGLFMKSGFDGYVTRRMDQTVIFKASPGNISSHYILLMYIDGKISKDQAVSWITKSSSVNPLFYSTIALYELPADEFVERMIMIKMCI